MSFRTVVVKNRSKLDLRMGYLVIRRDSEIIRVFLDEINTLIVENPACCITGCLLVELIKRKIKVIFCDEIGSAEEARAILGAQNSGVPLIATAHAESREALLRRPNIRMLYENSIFRYYIGLRRKPGARSFDFDVFDTLTAALV